MAKGKLFENVKFNISGRDTAMRILHDPAFGQKLATRGLRAMFYVYLCGWVSKDSREGLRATYLSVKRMVAEFRVSRSTIYSWLKLFEEQGILRREWLDWPGRSPRKCLVFLDDEEE